MLLSKTKLFATSLSFAAILALSGCANSQSNVEVKKVESIKSTTLLETYANLAFDSYNAALNDAKKLEKAIKTFALNPTEKNLALTKAAWLNSRESYGQTEAFRLSNGPIDAEEGWVADTYGSLEGQINAWPLDENMIDYTIDANGKRTSGNIIDTKGEFNPGGEESKAVDVTQINMDAITELNENGGDANVATGYHAIEFLLWGQDQDYSNFVKDGITNGALTAGKRAISDFTSDANAKRRLDYLEASAEKIVLDLEIITAAWEKKLDGNAGLYRAALLSKLTGKDSAKNISEEDALKQIFSGLGVFIKSELANERIAVAVLTPSEEDEHSCFSDNTHRDIAMNYQGFKNILMGTYAGKYYGKAPFDSLDKESADKVSALMSSIEEKIASIDSVAKTTEHFDYQIRPNNPQAKVIVKLKNELRKLGDEMVNVAAKNGIDLTVDDVTDAEETKI